MYKSYRMEKGNNYFELFLINSPQHSSKYILDDIEKEIFFLDILIKSISSRNNNLS